MLSIGSHSYMEWLQDIEPITAKGAVEQVTGLIIEGRGPLASIGGYV